MLRTAVVGAVLACAGFLGAAESREWSDRSGKYKIQAQLVVVKEGKAYLEKADGTITPVELTRLSPADLEHLQSLPECKAYFEKNPVAAEPGAATSAPKPKFAVIRTLDEVKSGEVRRFSDTRMHAKSLAFSPNGALLAIGRLDQGLSVYDIDKSNRTAAFEGLDGLGQVTALTFSPDGKKLLSGGYTGRIQVWNVGAGGTLTEGNRFAGHSGEIRVIRVSNDGKIVLSGGAEKKVRAWDLETGREQFAIDGFEGDIKDLFISRTGKQGLATDGAVLALIDMAQGKAVQTMKLLNPHVQSVSIAANGSVVAVSDLSSVRLLDVRSGREMPAMQDRGETAWSVRFLPSGKFLLVGGQGKVNVWDLSAKRKVYELDVAERGMVRMVAVSPDHRHFATESSGVGHSVQVLRLPPEVADEGAAVK